MIPQLITVAQAKAHQRITATNEDTDIDLKVSLASEIVMDYLKRADIPEEWIENHSPRTYDIPFVVQAATLLVFGELYENREAAVVNALSEPVMALLERFRDPAFS